mgnify:CR=1 FL=1
MKRRTKVVGIIGKSGVGKSFLVNKFYEIYKNKNMFNIIKSYSTRAPRDIEDFKTHTFVTEDFYNNAKKNNNIISDYRSPKNYNNFATHNLFLNSKINIFTVDVMAFNKLCEMPELYDCMAIVIDIDEETRRKRLEENRQEMFTVEDHLDIRLLNKKCKVLKIINEDDNDTKLVSNLYTMFSTMFEWGLK